MMTKEERDLVWASPSAWERALLNHADEADAQIAELEKSTAAMRRRADAFRASYEATQGVLSDVANALNSAGRKPGENVVEAAGEIARMAVDRDQWKARADSVARNVALDCAAVAIVAGAVDVAATIRAKFGIEGEVVPGVVVRKTGQVGQ